MCLDKQIGYEVLEKDLTVKKVCVKGLDGLYHAVYNIFEFQK